MLWINNPSIIVGKHQNPLAETNYLFAEENNIPIIRRISGGGAVYHDNENINFSFITSKEKTAGINFSYFLQPIIETINDCGIQVRKNERHNLFIDDNKITGTAAHLSRKKVIHHGTILFRSSLNNLKKVLENNYPKYIDKSIKSVPSPVTNIHQHLAQKVDLTTFTCLLEKKIKSRFNVQMDYHLSSTDLYEVELIKNKKYKSWEWNFGYSPDYVYKNNICTKNSEITTELIVKKGIIKKAFISKDHFPIIELSNMIENLPHQYNNISEILYQTRQDIFDVAMFF
jgi:lipoate-protein ligase A